MPTRKPVAKKPIAKKPIAKKPAAKKPAAKKPTAKKPAAKKPAAKKPAPAAPAAKKPVAKPPAAKKSAPAFTEKGKGLRPRPSRSQTAPMPAYRLAGAGDLGPEVAEILRFVGLQPTRPLGPDEMQRLLKAPADIFTVADNAAAQFGKDAGLLSLRDFGGDQLAALAERAQYLRVRPQHLQEAATIAQHQQLVATSDLQDALLRIRRRVLSLLEEWPELRSRWQFLLDYFERMYPGPGPETKDGKDGKDSKPPKPEGA